MRLSRFATILALAAVAVLATQAASGAGSHDDPSVAADLETLRELVRAQMEPFALEPFDAADVRIRFVGKGAVSDEVVDDEWRTDPGRSDARQDTVVVCIRWRTEHEVHPNLARFLVALHVATFGPCDRSWRAFNPATRNEFKIDVPERVLAAIHLRQEQNGETQSFKGRVGDSGGDAPEDGSTVPGPPAGGGAATNSFSDGVDNRVLLTPTTSWPWRTIADMGGCTTTFVGPRLVVTAGHCVYSRTNQTWFLNLTVTPGMDRGNTPYGSVSLPPGPGETGWYFTPSQWRALSPSGGSAQHDFAAAVFPGRKGDEIGWMGYVTRPSGDLDAARNYNRGYPWCESQTGGSPKNPERIDEPDNVSQAADGSFPGGGSCFINGLYGDTGDCDLGNWSKSDGSWWRRVRHSCDAGAAMSGSPLYHYWPSWPNAVLHAVHTTSLKCRLTTDNACDASDDRPLEATRLTVEYRNWISYFRSLFP